MKATNQQYQRIYNRCLVLNTLRTCKGISRVEIADRLGLKKSSVTNIVSELLEQNLVQIIGEGTASNQGGRRPIQLGLNEDFRLVLGIEFQAGYYRAVMMNLGGQVLGTYKQTYDLSQLPTEDMMIQVIESERKNIDKNILSGIAIAIPGVVNSHTGMVIKSDPLQLKDYPLGDILTEKLDLPVIIENDAYCGAWGELQLITERKGHDFIFLLSEYHEPNQVSGQENGMSVGLGIVLNGKVHYGGQNGAGEFKSYKWTPEYSGQTAIPNTRMKIVHTDIEVMKDFIEELFQNMSVLTAVLNPLNIYIGGDLREYTALIEEVINERLKDTVIQQRVQDGLLKVSTYGRNDIAAGAASMYLERIFSVPDLSIIRQENKVDYSTLYAV